jgi:DNA end-binding protein Ku
MSLISSLEAEFEPEKYKDEYRENLMSMIQAKVQGRQVVETPTAQQLAPVVDIMEALKASHARGKKPPQSVARAEQAATEVPEAAAASKPKRGRKSAQG